MICCNVELWEWNVRVQFGKGGNFKKVLSNYRVFVTGGSRLSAVPQPLGEDPRGLGVPPRNNGTRRPRFPDVAGPGGRAGGGAAEGFHGQRGPRGICKSEESYVCRKFQ